jgi:NAD(P)-dependent dehydrogenase (short-subunit alcohol dehydrogenase family)
MGVECVVAGIGTENSSREFNLRAVAKDILDNQCLEWTMDGGIREHGVMTTAKLKNVLITGATDGLGKAAALLLAQHGYRVFAAGRSEEKRRHLDEMARKQKLPLETLDMDVCDDASVKEGVAAVISKAGSVDVLINNAGIIYVSTVEDTRMEDWRRQFETNFFGVVRMTQAVLAHMRTRRRGRILMVSSVSGIITPPTHGPYSSTKHAMEGLSNALRLEMYPFGVEVILIEPGYIMTNLQNIAAELMEPYADKITAGPYARIYSGAYAGTTSARKRSKTTPEDCARVMLKAIEAPSPKARYGVTPLATMAKWAKRLLPDSAIDSIIRRRYGIVRDRSNGD